MADKALLSESAILGLHIYVYTWSGLPREDDPVLVDSYQYDR